MKKLPKIYKNNIDKTIKNNKEVCYLNRESVVEVKNSFSINEVLNNIFNGIGYSYNIPVIIETDDKVYDTFLITRTKNNVVTLDNEVISIDEIKNITIKDFK